MPNFHLATEQHEHNFRAAYEQIQSSKIEHFVAEKNNLEQRRFFLFRKKNFFNKEKRRGSEEPFL